MGQMTQPTVQSTEGKHETKLNQIQQNTKSILTKEYR